MDKNGEMVYKYIDGKFVLVPKIDQEKSVHVPTTEQGPIEEPQISFKKENNPTRNYFLLQCPFLYSKDNCPYEIKSVDEFYAIVKKDNIPLGEIIRSSDYSSYKKRKIVKKTFKRWVKLYNQKTLETVDDTEKNLEVLYDRNIRKVSVWLNILLAVVIVLTMMIVYPDSIFWRMAGQADFGKTLYEIVYRESIRAPWIRVVGYITIVLSVLYYIFLIFRSVLRENFKNKFRYNKKTVSKTSEKSMEKQRKLFYKAEKYFLKGIKKIKKLKPVVPYPIEKVSIYMEGTTKFEKYKMDLKNEILKFEKQKKIITRTNIISAAAVIIGLGTIIGYFIYAIISM